MPRRRRARVQLTEADLALVAGRLVAVLPSAVVDVPERPASILEILRPLGASRREQVTRAALAISGGAEKSSRAYKSARRRVERYVTEAGERRGRVRGRFDEIARAVRRPHLPMDAGLSVELCADVFYEGQHKCPMPAHGEGQEIDPSQLATVRRFLREGDEIAAATALLDEWVYQYRLNTERRARGVIGNIDRARIEVR